MTEKPAETLRNLIDGFRLSQAIYVIATLGIPDLVAGGARSAGDLAEELDCNYDALYRVLRYLAAAGVLHEDGDQSFSLTPVGESLRTDVPGSLAAWARLAPRPYLWETWGQLLETVRTGDHAFPKTHGMDVWDYRRAHPEESAIFDAAMTARTLRMNESVAANYDFSRFSTIVDVGGGQGALLAAILDAHPHVRGILFDQEHVAANTPGHDRIEVASGDFFREVPAGADAYVLKWIIHDWDDEEARAILRAVRAAAKDTSVVLVIDQIVPPPNEGLDAKLIDLQMLLITGGRERTREEFAALFEATDFRYVSDSLAGDGNSIIEAVPAS